jgi:hypothetical protein
LKLVVLPGQGVLHIFKLLGPGRGADREHRPKVSQELVHLFVKGRRKRFANVQKGASESARRSRDIIKSESISKKTFST